MSDSGGKTASSLAITEKKPQRAGGCIGIFFQLFDWNRRFANKKLFSKKLLPPVRLKQASKKFGGDDKQPKLRLIADENSGGFPNVKKNGVSNSDSEQKHEMRSPSLVARLMGLESMPAVQRGKPKKASSFAAGSDRVDKYVNGCTGFEREELSLDKGEAKNEWRPQKLQKTGVSERRPIAKFGAEALQFKSILSRSRKHHQPKLGSPVKSPRNLSGRNASRLIGAATRILEPGLQRSRARCALTYSNTLKHPPKHESLLEETTHLSPDDFYNSSYYPSVAATPPTVQSSCENCGHMLDISDSSHNVEEKESGFASPVSHYVNTCGQGSERIMPRQFIFYQEPQEEKERDKSPYDSALPTGTGKPCSEPAHRKPPRREGQVRWHLTSQQSEPQKHVNSSASLKQKTQMSNQTLQGRDRTSKKTKSSSLQGNRVKAAANAICETKNVVASQPSFSSHDRLRMPAKIDCCKFQTERKTGNRKKDSMSSVQKKGPSTVCRHYESSGFVSSSFKNTRSDVMTGKEASTGNFINRQRNETRLAHLGEQSRSGTSGKKGSDVVSFTFNTLVKHKTGNCKEDANRGELNDSSSENASQKPIVDRKDLGTNSQKPLPLSGDALSALLEQKLKELTSQDEDEFVKGGTTPRKTTAMILQELISALTAGQPFHDDLAVQANCKTGSYHHPQTSNIDTTFTFKSQAKQKSTTTLVRHDHDDRERLSPGSILEASFSNDSCPSSSFGDSSISGNKLVHESIGCFQDELSASELDANLLDSATSLITAKNDRQTVSRLLNNVSEVLCNINLSGTVLKGNKLTHVEEVLLNAELMLGIAESEFSVSHFLLTELEMLASMIWMSFSCTRVCNQLEGFTFDSIIEYLDSRYNRLSKCGFAAWSRTPLHVDSEMLIQEIVQEIRRWSEMAGMIPDDLIEWDMSHSLGKWTDFEIEAFETGAEIDGHIIQLIIDEIVIDLWKC